MCSTDGIKLKAPVIPTLQLQLNLYQNFSRNSLSTRCSTSVKHQPISMDGDHTDIALRFINQYEKFPGAFDLYSPSMLERIGLIAVIIFKFCISGSRYKQFKQGF